MTERSHSRPYDGRVQPRSSSGARAPAALLRAVAKAIVAAGSAIVALAGCAAPFPSPMAGTVIATEQGAPVDGRDRWVTTIFLDQGQVLGSADVQVAFWAEDLVCGGGAPVPDGPSGLVAGTRLVVDFDPEAPVDASDPPVVNGLKLTASCPAG